MNVRHITTFVCACALGAVAGHWYAHSRFDSAPRTSVLCNDVASKRAHSPLPTEGEHVDADDRRGSELESTSPTVAFERALQQREPELRLAGLRRAFSRLVGADLMQALRQTERIADDERDAIVAPVLSAWARHNSRDAWLALNHMDLAHEYRLAVLAGIAEHDAQEAANWLRTSARNPEVSSSIVEMYRIVVPALLQTGSSNAAALIVELGRDAPLDLIQQVAASHGKHDPLDGLVWASNLGQRTDYERMQALQAVSASIVAVDPDAAVAVLNRTGDAAIRQHVIRAIAGYKAQRSVRDAWEWLQTYRADEAYRESARAMLSAWSYAKPAEVAAVVLEMDDVEFQRGAAEQLSNVWEERDPHALREWIATLPDGKLRDALRPLLRGAGEG